MPVARAGRLPPTGLRSLAALHLATAWSVPGHDVRLQAAAAAVGLLALSPGAP